MAHTSGLRVGLLISLFLVFYPLTGSIVTVRYKPPRVDPTRGAPSFLNVPVYCKSRILSSVDAVKWKENSESAPPPTNETGAPDLGDAR